MDAPDVPIAEAINRLIKKNRQAVRIVAAAVTAFSAGRTTIRRAGSTQPEAGLPRLIPAVPKAGDRVAVAAIGGAATVLGVISRAAVGLLDLGAPLVGQSYDTGDSASAATTASNTSNTTWETVRSFTWSSLPDGTYDLVVDWSAQFSDSAASSINVRLVVAGANDTTFTISVPTTRETLRYVRTFDDQVVAGGLTVTIQYKRNSGSGTAAARNPAMKLTATRVA